MRATNKKITILVVMLTVLGLAGLTYAAGPKTDVPPMASGGASGSLVGVNALYIPGQGPTFELAHWGYRGYYRPYYRYYGYSPYRYYYPYSYYSYGYYPKYRYHKKHFRHFKPYRTYRY